MENLFTVSTMALTSLAAELMNSLQVYGYRKYIPALHCGTGVTDKLFAAMPDSKNFTIDTSRTYRGKCGKTVNPSFMFKIFGVYCGDEPDVVRVRMINWIRDNLDKFEKNYRSSYDWQRSRTGIVSYQHELCENTG